ncbi:MerR family transcriptional regulator [Streptomyces sp. SID14515]|uniref:MerR family transcriptional regulator n=1 Tax=Streptomyces sp. SID14515 TaxID=2706074 RepID=UPI0013C66E73|nr:MerR family transcriptional regulator [Streptomyces sp. SID14515]NEB37015.1 MerR family transcriptional regulator [Streptomyces sp. SID14515]
MTGTPGAACRVKIGDAAAFVDITPRAIRHYHEIGLLPEPERGSDGRRRYGYEDMIRLLWIRRTADAGIALDDIRDAFAGTASADADSDDGIAGILERLEETLLAQEAELRRQRTAVRRMRTEGSRMGLLSHFVTDRLRSLPEGSLRQADLDSLLVTERIFGPLGAAVQASRFIALATHPDLREESDRVAAADEDEPEAGQGSGGRHASMSAYEAIGRMPYDFSPARLRCMELAGELAAHEPPAS